MREISENNPYRRRKVKDKADSKKYSVTDLGISALSILIVGYLISQGISTNNNLRNIKPQSANLDYIATFSELNTNEAEPKYVFDEPSSVEGATNKKEYTEKEIYTNIQKFLNYKSANNPNLQEKLENSSGKVKDMLPQLKTDIYQKVNSSDSLQELISEHGEVIAVSSAASKIYDSGNEQPYASIVYADGYQGNILFSEEFGIPPYIVAASLIGPSQDLDDEKYGITVHPDDVSQAYYAALATLVNSYGTKELVKGIDGTGTKLEFILNNPTTIAWAKGTCNTALEQENAEQIIE